MSHVVLPVMLALSCYPDDSSAPSGNTRILVSEGIHFSPTAIDLISSHGQVQVGELDRKRLLADVATADVLWVRLRHRIDREVIDAAPRLKMIVTPTTGLNHIDLEAASQRNIHVLSLRGETDFLKDIRATAELTIGLILALLRHLPSATIHTRQGGWNRDRFRGGELYGKTIGIVGYGRLGKIVAQYLAAFDACILATDPIIDSGKIPSHVSIVSLEQLLRESEIVSLHVNLTEETIGFFGESQFASMRSGSFFINTSRGELIDESALLSALQVGRLAGAALDVLSNEKSTGMQEHQLVEYAKKHDNLLITPHIGGCTVESMEKTEIYLAQQFARIWPTLRLGAE